MMRSVRPHYLRAKQGVGNSFRNQEMLTKKKSISRNRIWINEINQVNTRHVKHNRTANITALTATTKNITTKDQLKTGLSN